MGGVPCLRGVVGMAADGLSEEDILKAFPDLQPEDVCEALR